MISSATPTVPDPEVYTPMTDVLSETELTLEELDQVFSVPTWKHASYQIKNARWHIKKYVFFQRHQEPLEPFYQGAEKLNT